MMPLRRFLLAACLGAGAVRGAPADPAILREEFIYTPGPVPSCHASTLAETAPGQLAAAWFGGTREGAPDVGIWLSTFRDGVWAPAREVANGAQPGGGRFATWNPVLYQAPGGPLLLFFKAGPSPAKWWGLLMRSADGGRTWSAPARLPAGLLGPIKDKPVRLADGTLLCGSSTEGDGWRVHFESTPDLGASWRTTGPINAPPDDFNAIQPSILVHPGGVLQALCRTRELNVATTWSADGGRTWSRLAPTGLYGPNSGLDAVTLADGRCLLVYNRRDHSPQAAPPGENWKARYPLNLCLSPDGKAWAMRLVLEDEPRPDGYAYPAVIQAADGLVHVTYTWNRQRIKHVVLDPRRL
jgi:predicted neuraminidase